MKTILINFKNFQDNSAFSRSLKIILTSLNDIDFNLYGGKSEISNYENYSPKLKLCYEESFNIENLTNESDGIILLNSSNVKFDNDMFIFRTRNKKMLVCATNNLENFIKLNNKLNEDFFIFKEEESFFDLKITSLASFKGTISFTDFLNDDSKFILSSLNFFNNFISSLKSISNYFYKQDEPNFKLKKHQSKLNKLFTSKNNELKEEESLYRDFLYPIHIHFLNNKFYITFENDAKLNAYMKGIYILDSLIDNKLDLINK